MHPYLIGGLGAGIVLAAAKVGAVHDKAQGDAFHSDAFTYTMMVSSTVMSVGGILASSSKDMRTTGLALALGAAIGVGVAAIAADLHKTLLTPTNAISTTKALA